jgi:hypothetical protein
MLARVTRWEGGSAEGIRAASEQMRANVAQGPPPGVRSSGLTVLADPEGGEVMMIGLFESEQDLRDAESVLAQMDPPEGMGTRGQPRVYEVATEVRT